MQIIRLQFEELSSRQIDAWSELQRANSTFRSPFFRPEYAAVVSQFQPHVEVVVLHEGGREVGFWPYQRCTGNVARPVGLHLSDFQGLVAAPEVAWSARDLLRACDLKAWAFDHAVASQSPLSPFHWMQCESPVIDLSQGFESYRQQKRRDGSSSLEQALRKSRKLERECGPLRLVPHCDDERVFESVIEWKRDQYQRIGSVDHLAEPWTRELLKQLCTVRGEHFSGMLSAMYAGDKLVAAHLGIRTSEVLHCWFPTYNRDFQQYSPGIVFWLLQAQQAAELGIRQIDLGKGDERYKQSLKTGDVTLAEGAVDFRFGRRHLGRTWHRARRAIRKSRFTSPLRSLVRSIRAVRNRRATGSETPHQPAAAFIHSQDESMALTCD